MENNNKLLRSHRIRAALPIRIRGMSSEHKFFDEQSESLILSDHELMTRIHAEPELDTEIHIASLKNEMTGTFRVSWLSPASQSGAFNVGLERIESEGDLWEMDFPAAADPAIESLPEAQLQCRRCHERRVCTIPEAEEDFIRPGFRIARPCELCKATTIWEFVTETEFSKSEQGGASPKSSANHRGKGRAPLRIQVKVTRTMYGSVLEDICHTENVSRTGAYFYSQQGYEVGEKLSVVLPYKKGDLAIPLAARVVRLDQPGSGKYLGVAIQIVSGENG